MFKLKTSASRLKYWKNFRFKIDQLPLEEALQETVDFWQSCPWTAFYLDQERPATWPNAWDLIVDNYYCDLAKVLGIVYTLNLSEHGKNLAVEVRVYTDPKTGYQYCIAYLDQGKYILNLIDNRVLNKTDIAETLKLKRCYVATELKLERY